MGSPKLTLGKALRELRQRSRLTQVELAQRLDVGPTYISHLEGDRREPSLDLLRRLAQVLDVSYPLLIATFLAVDVPPAQASSYGQIVEKLWRLTLRERGDATTEKEREDT